MTVYRRCDRVFAALMVVQWLFALFLALVYSPHAWAGKVHSTHIHVYYAALLGGALSGPVILLTFIRPGAAITRHAVAVSQMLWSALLIHLTGGRIETHFHVFGSLAFLAFYRDWKVLIPATVVVAGDHLLRGFFWPESVYGITNPEWWRFLEHAFWVLFEDTVLVMGILETLREMKALAARHVEMEELNTTIEDKIVERTRELETSREQYRSLVETTRTVPWQFDLTSRRFSYVGPQGGELLGCTAQDWLQPGFWDARIHPDDVIKVKEQWLHSCDTDTDFDHEFRLKRNDGTWVWLRSITGGLRDSRDSQLSGILIDVTERRRMELELQQAQKLESVGRLAAGVAHEINTPIQFVSDSVHFVRDAVQDLARLIGEYEGLHRGALAGNVSAASAAAVTKAKAEADLPYLLEHIPKALDRSLEGLDRVTTIVRSMKEFAHPDQREMAAIDLNRSLQSTLTIARNEYKYVADVETDLEELPPVTCHVGDLNQAILNVVVNAAHAIGDVVQDSGRRGRITVRTRREDDFAIIEISDTGNGIPEEIRDRIFDPFFTTKEVGKGTGQGLAIAHAIVKEKHGGELTFETTIGQGTTFSIRLPIHGVSRQGAGVAA